MYVDGMYQRRTQQTCSYAERIHIAARDYRLQGRGLSDADYLENCERSVERTGALESERQVVPLLKVDMNGVTCIVDGVKHVLI